MQKWSSASRTDSYLRSGLVLGLVLLLLGVISVDTYHPRELADEELIDVSDDGKYTRYYPATDFDEADQTVMNALRREYSRRILAHLLADGPLSTTDLSDRLDKAQSTISWHLSELADLVTKERDGRSVVCEVTNPARDKYLYTVHRQSFTDRVVDRLLGLWDSY